MANITATWTFLQSLLAAADGTEPTVWMPRQASTFAERTDTLFYFIYYLGAFFFVLIIAATVLFAVKYRRRKAGERTSPIEGNQRLEIIWSVIPAVLLVVMFVWGFRDYMTLTVPPSGAIDVRVLAERWRWSFTYPDYGIEVSGTIDKEKDVDDPFVVPQGRPVKLTMSSKDVIHSFYVPAFRVKKDVIPNRYSVIWFEASELGTFDVLCAEYCGRDHSRMVAKIRVVSPTEFEKWTETGGGPPDGSKLFVTKGCATCHSITKARMGKAGPPMAGKYGSEELLVDGTKVTVDDNYIRESIMEPNAKVVQGYAPVMPTFAGQLSDPQINALIDYIKSLK